MSGVSYDTYALLKQKQDFINEIKKNNYFRFKALKELNSITGDYSTTIDIKKCIFYLRALL